MLRFFRHIRQRLLTDNKFSKYLLYAIGEILLVVLGILIALQVNNWNESKKEQALGNSYLERILREVKKDTSILVLKIRNADKLKRGYLNFIQKMHYPQATREDFVNLINSVEFNVDELLLTDIAYTELVNTGRIDLIPNKNLKDQTTEYYRNYAFISSRVRELNETSLKVIQSASVAAPIFKYTVPADLDSQQENPLDRNTPAMYHESEWAFMNNPQSMEFKLWEETVYYYYGKQVWLTPMYKGLLAEAIELMQTIELDLHHTD